MRQFITRYRWLITIAVLAAALRFWQLGNVPPSLDWDEAALGYNAYSILKTGRDEYGTWFPLTIRSFDDYKPPLYVYLTIPAIFLFGLEPWAVRLPSALAGTLAVFFTYFLVLELFNLRTQISNHHDQPGTKNFTGHWVLELKFLALLSALLLAISPWHVQFSRIAFEANIGVTINILAVVSFLRGLRSKPWLGISAFLFGLALYAYHSERIFIPLLVLLLAIVFRNDLLKIKKEVGIASIIGVLTVTPLVPVFFNQTTLLRLRGTSSLVDQTGLLARSVTKLEYDRQHGNPWGVIFDNRRLVWAKTLLDGYLAHYSFRWLFITGDNARHHAPDMGLLYLFELPFLLYGMFLLGKKGGKVGKLIWGWFLIAPVGASPTTELPHAIRALVFLPTFQIFTGVGILASISNIKCLIANKKNVYWRSVILVATVGYILFLIFNISYYLHMYFGHTNHEYSKYWQYGYQEAVAYTSAHRNEYQKIVVSTTLEQPHMFFLFYLKYDPLRYLEEGGTRSGGFAEVRNKFESYEFRPIQWDQETRDGSVLYVAAPQEISGSPLTTIKYLNGEEAMKIASR